MASINKVILVGNLGRDPELRYTPNGQAVANFTLATNETFTNKDGNKETRTEWHRVVAWGKLGEFCGEYLAKGKQIYVEGKLRTRKWEDKTGAQRQTTEVMAQTLQMLGRPEDGSTSTNNNVTVPESTTNTSSQSPEDDVPF